ncbi:hypothetical protein MBANPS3_011834 [Mucor bainieri]
MLIASTPITLYRIESITLSSKLTQISSENTVQPHLARSLYEHSHLSSTKLDSDLIATNHTTFGVAQLHTTNANQDDDTSDNESTSSFYTAPDSPPVHQALDYDSIVDMNRQNQSATSMEELQGEQDRLARELEIKDLQIEKIACTIDAKRAELKELALKQLEYRARKSFFRNSCL